jgi:cysteine-rich repeat protein
LALSDGIDDIIVDGEETSFTNTFPLSVSTLLTELIIGLDYTWTITAEDASDDDIIDIAVATGNFYIFDSAEECTTGNENTITETILDIYSNPIGTCAEIITCTDSSTWPDPTGECTYIACISGWEPHATNDECVECPVLTIAHAHYVSECDWGCDAGYTGPACEPDCGDGYIVEGEECDDTNTVDIGDGCDNNCQMETGWVCTEEPSVCSEMSFAVSGPVPYYIGYSTIDLIIEGFSPNEITLTSIPAGASYSDFSGKPVSPAGEFQPWSSGKFTLIPPTGHGLSSLDIQVCGYAGTGGDECWVLGETGQACGDTIGTACDDIGLSCDIPTSPTDWEINNLICQTLIAQDILGSLVDNFAPAAVVGAFCKQPINTPLCDIAPMSTYQRICKCE